MTPDDEKLRRFLAASAVGYGIAGLNLLIRRKSFETDMKRIDGKRRPPDIWPALGVAYMATIAAVAWSASRDRQRAGELVKPLLVAKATTSALFANQFLRTRRRSFLLATLVDGAILAITLWLSSRGSHLAPASSRQPAESGNRLTASRSGLALDRQSLFSPADDPIRHREHVRVAHLLE